MGLGRWNLLLVPVALAAACTPRIADVDLAARVNGAPVLKTDFAQQVEVQVVRYRGHGQQLPPGIEARLKESILKRMVEDEVLMQQAKAMQLSISDADVEAKFREHRDRFRSEEAFGDYLTRSNNSEANLKSELRRNLLRDLVIDTLMAPIVVTEADVLAFYSDNAHKYRNKETVRAQRILIRAASDMPAADRRKAKKRATQVLAQARAQGADFGKLAHDVSEGGEAAQNGETGPVTRGHVPLEFENAVFNTLKPGETSGLIETLAGYEIYHVIDHKDAETKPLDEVRDSIRGAMTARAQNDKRREILTQLRDAAKVEVLVQFDAPATPQVPVPPDGITKAALR